jgi:hypothetical protein
MKGYLLITGLIFAALGLYTLLDPQAAIYTQTGMHMETIAALSQIRGTSGGVTLVVGGFLIAASRRSALELAALWSVVLILSGLELGRLLSLIVDGVPPANVGVSALIENIGLWQGVYWLRRILRDQAEAAK